MKTPYSFYLAGISVLVSFGGGVIGSSLVFFGGLVICLAFATHMNMSQKRYLRRLKAVKDGD